jgi:hypothetical protein
MSARAARPDRPSTSAPTASTAALEPAGSARIQADAVHSSGARSAWSDGALTQPVVPLSAKRAPSLAATPLGLRLPSTERHAAPAGCVGDIEHTAAGELVLEHRRRAPDLSGPQSVRRVNLGVVAPGEHFLSPDGKTLIAARPTDDHIHGAGRMIMAFNAETGQTIPLVGRGEHATRLTKVQWVDLDFSTGLAGNRGAPIHVPPAGLVGASPAAPSSPRSEGLTRVVFLVVQEPDGCHRTFVSNPVTGLLYGTCDGDASVDTSGQFVDPTVKIRLESRDDRGDLRTYAHATTAFAIVRDGHVHRELAADRALGSLRVDGSQRRTLTPDDVVEWKRRYYGDDLLETHPGHAAGGLRALTSLDGTATPGVQQTVDAIRATFETALQR